MPVEVQNIRTRAEFEALQKRLGTYTAVQNAEITSAEDVQRRYREIISNNKMHLVKEAGKGAADGAAIVLNKLTGGVISPLDRHVQNLIAENGGLYETADLLAGFGATALDFAMMNPCKFGGNIARWYNRAQVGVSVISGGKSLAQGDYLGGMLELGMSGMQLRGMNAACFAGEVEVLTRDRGVLRWDQVREGDYLASCHDDEPRGLIEYKRVEDVFSTQAPIWHIHLHEPGDVSPRIIRTTAEHPFWVHGKGWTATTWGEAVRIRGAGQSPPIGPTGTPTPPKLPKPKS